MADRQRLGHGLLIPLVALAISAAPASSGVYVVCEPASGTVLLEERVDESRQIVMEGPLPGERTAAIWIDENCPDRICDERGVCGSQRDAPRTETGPSWLVVCDASSGAVGMVQAPPPPGLLLLAGRDGSAKQHADRDAARSWTDENCPSQRCDAAGTCVATDGTVSGGGGGWVAGELTSETVGAPSGGNKAPTREPLGPAGAAGGPPAADLSPLINNTQAAANGCSYPAALRSVDQIANFDSGHPFYAANRDKLWRLAERQRQTEQTVWQARSALEAGDLKRARELSWAAANIAVSCQARAVSTLVGGIDTAIKQVREQKDLKRRKAAAMLLPGLVSLSNALIGAESGVPVDVDALMAEIGPSVGLDLPLGALDPCAFKYDYGSASSVEPTCSCAGYRFDPGQFRCTE